MKHFLLTLLASYFSLAASAQTFQTLYGGEGMDMFMHIEQLPDQDFLMSAISGSQGESSEMVLMRTDGIGKIEWVVSGGTPGSDFLEDFSYDKSTGMFYVCGTVPGLSPNSGPNIFYGKFSLLGTEIWSKTINTGSDDYASSIKLTADGGFILTGGTEGNSGLGLTDIVLLKGDSDGNIEWVKTMGTEGEDKSVALAETANRDIIVLGYGDALNGQSNFNLFVLKLNAKGTLLQSKVLLGSDDEVAYSLTYEEEKEELFISASTQSYGAGQIDGALLKLSTDLEIEWMKAIGSPSHDYISHVEYDKDDELVISGHTSAITENGLDVMLLKLNSEDEPVFFKTLGGELKDVGFHMVTTPELGIAIAGYTRSFDAEYVDAYFMKADLRGNSTCNTYQAESLISIEDVETAFTDISNLEFYSQQFVPQDSGIDFSYTESFDEYTMCSYGTVNPYLSEENVELEATTDFSTDNNSNGFNFEEALSDRSSQSTIRLNEQHNLIVEQSDDLSIKSINIYSISGKLLYFNDSFSSEELVEIELSGIIKPGNIVLVNLHYTNGEIRTEKLHVN